ncbi:reverse transcriptase (RNA-dependent DNA polymerase) [Hirsutella rhossiliensis]|uniref:Reverse transcriptase (RNA-dependent DNA polymerase) domain-containing protein n=1 Tax=Hirsutella rhossiliensis TaxID=111463 RepID=A0A9P8SLK8_9HYPO|nr:reverse transcriptase (RNA-dependent DNA polymerase) domain-containing protein [Hirsutella rhossiliensis]KAH0967578.1 reverse transcriptase (RNA-dependent DNA polymerase) domain-containing protein [Hirsutella rhossiliensis]
MLHRNLPQLSLKITSFTDATLVAITAPHVSWDYFGILALMQSVQLLLAERENEIPQMLGARNDILDDLANQYPTPGLSTNPSLRDGSMPAPAPTDRSLEESLEERTIFLPRRVVSNLRTQVQDEGRAEYRCPNDEELLLAWVIQQVAKAQDYPLLFLRSAEQALLLLQEQVYKAWRNHKVLSLISFDVPGAYNGVCKEILLERMKSRGIPAELVRWIDAFCSERTASLVVSGYTSEQRELPQAGLPQGSPLSPILFLFFNADLVQRRIKAESGSIAFIDDYSAWVTGPTAEANREGIQAAINDALKWEARSGATFEADKMTIIHFTRATVRNSNRPFLIRGQEVQPKESAKILGVIMAQGIPVDLAGEEEKEEAGEMERWRCSTSDSSCS